MAFAPDSLPHLRPVRVSHEAALRALTRFWVERRSGVLCYSRPGAAQDLSLVASLARGAAVCEPGHQILREVPSGGELVLLDVEVDAEGDWNQTGAALYRAALDAVVREGGCARPTEVLTWSRIGQAAWVLPMASALATLTPALSASLPLLTVMPEEAEARRSLLCAVGALRRMGLVEGEDDVILAEDPLEPPVAHQLISELIGAIDSCRERCPGDVRCVRWECAPPVGQAEAGQEPDQDALLQEGLRLAEQQRWAEADAVLTRARDLRFDCAPVLAALAEVRSHNPTLPEAQRRRDARRLFRLARQIDPGDPSVASTPTGFGEDSVVPD